MHCLTLIVDVAAVLVLFSFVAQAAPTRTGRTKSTNDYNNSTYETESRSHRSASSDRRGDISKHRSDYYYGKDYSGDNASSIYSRAKNRSNINKFRPNYNYEEEDYSGDDSSIYYRTKSRSNTDRPTFSGDRREDSSKFRSKFRSNYEEDYSSDDSSIYFRTKSRSDTYKSTYSGDRRDDTSNSGSDYHHGEEDYSSDDSSIYSRTKSRRDTNKSTYSGDRRGDSSNSRSDYHYGEDDYSSDDSSIYSQTKSRRDTNKSTYSGDRRGDSSNSRSDYHYGEDGYSSDDSSIYSQTKSRRDTNKSTYSGDRRSDTSNSRSDSYREDDYYGDTSTIASHSTDATDTDLTLTPPSPKTHPYDINFHSTGKDRKSGSDEFYSRRTPPESTFDSSSSLRLTPDIHDRRSHSHRDGRNDRRRDHNKSYSKSGSSNRNSHSHLTPKESTFDSLSSDIHRHGRNNGSRNYHKKARSRGPSKSKTSDHSSSPGHGDGSYSKSGSSNGKDGSRFYLQQTPEESAYDSLSPDIHDQHKKTPSREASLTPSSQTKTSDRSSSSGQGDGRIERTDDGARLYPTDPSEPRSEPTSAPQAPILDLSVTQASATSSDGRLPSILKKNSYSKSGNTVTWKDPLTETQEPRTTENYISDEESPGSSPPRTPSPALSDASTRTVYDDFHSEPNSLRDVEEYVSKHPFVYGYTPAQSPEPHAPSATQTRDERKPSTPQSSAQNNRKDLRS